MWIAPWFTAVSQNSCFHRCTCIILALKPTACTLTWYITVISTSHEPKASSLCIPATAWLQEILRADSMYVAAKTIWIPKQFGYQHQNIILDVPSHNSRYSSTFTKEAVAILYVLGHTFPLLIHWVTVWSDWNHLTPHSALRHSPSTIAYFLEALLLLFFLGLNHSGLEGSHKEWLLHIPRLLWFAHVGGRYPHFWVTSHTSRVGWVAIGRFMINNNSQGGIYSG